MNVSAIAREIKGKKVRSLRAQQQIPAVVYGFGVESRMLSVPEGAFLNKWRAAGETSIVDLMVDGKTYKVLIKDVRRDPVSGAVLHVDFQSVNMAKQIKAQVPLVVKGEAKAVKELGAVLVRSLGHLEVECLPQDLPHAIEVDVGHLAAIGAMIRVGDLTLPPHVRVLTKPEMTVVVIEKKTEEVETPVVAVAPDLSTVKTEGEMKREEKQAKAEQEKTIDAK